jgi:hypothetical protein
MSGPDLVMVHQTSGRRDFRMYGLLGVGLVFVYGGATIDPATNCSSGGECAPWLVPVAFWMGVLATLGGGAALLRNPRRGSRINQRWDEAHSPDVRSLKLADVAVIRIDASSDTSTVMLFDRRGELMPYAGAEVTPWPFADWAHGVAKRYPHIRVEAD